MRNGLPVNEREPMACIGCGAALPLLRHYKTYLCASCKNNGLRRQGTGAHILVASAIRYGYLPHPTTLVCVDCGVPATEYDHRDYSKPLEVDAVCRSCNFARGPAKPFVPAVAQKAQAEALTQMDEA